MRRAPCAVRRAPCAFLILNEYLISFFCGPPHFAADFLTPRVIDYLYSNFVNNDDIDLYETVIETMFPGPNMSQYNLLCYRYDVITHMGLNNYRREVLPMHLVLHTNNGEPTQTGIMILPFFLYKWTMQIEEGNVIENL